MFSLLVLPHTLPFLSSVGSLPWETVFHKFLQCESLWAAVLSELFHCGPLPQGAVLQWGTPCGVTNPGSKSAPAWAPLSMAMLVLTGACSSSVKGSLTLLLPEWDVLWDAGDFCTSIDLHGLQGHILPHPYLHHRLQGSSIWSTSSLSFTDLVCRTLLYCWSHSDFVGFGVFFCLFPPLKYSTTEVFPSY